MLNSELGIDFPDFEEIERVCREKIKEKFPDYKNSWNDQFLPLSWWEKRLRNEIEEIFSAKSPQEYAKEIPDAINILAMMYSNAVKKCTKCEKSVVEWHSLDGKILCTECYLN